MILNTLYLQYHIIRVGDSAVRGASTTLSYKFLTILLPKRFGLSVFMSFPCFIDSISICKALIPVTDSFLSLRNFMIPLGLAESPCVEFIPMPL